MTDLTAKNVMTTAVQTVRADTPLPEIAELLAAQCISGVPVVDEEQHVVGILSESDLIDDHKREARIPRTALYGVFPLPDDVLREAAQRGQMLQASDLMTKKVVTATEDIPVHALADLMVQRKVNRIPILRAGRLVGIVCRADLVRVFAQGPGGGTAARSGAGPRGEAGG
jgi:CBS domain-containing protein